MPFFDIFWRAFRSDDCRLPVWIGDESGRPSLLQRLGALNIDKPPRYYTLQVKKLPQQALPEHANATTLVTFCQTTAKSALGQ